MMNNTRQLVSDCQLFCLFVLMTLPRLLLFTTMNAAAAVTELAVSAAGCAAAYFARRYCRGGVQKYGSKAVALLLPVLFAGTVRDLLLFTGQAAFHEVPLTVLLVMATGASLYAASLKTEALARFGFLCVLFAAAVLAIGVWYTAGKSKAVPLSWQWELHSYHLLDCLSLPAVYWLLGDNGGVHSGAALTAGLLVPYGAVIGLMALSASLLGAAATVYHYPLFVLFQLCKGRGFSGLDMLYIALLLCCTAAKGGLLLCLFRREFSGGFRCQENEKQPL